MANTYIKCVNYSNFKKLLTLHSWLNSKQIKCHLHTRIQGNKWSLLDSSSRHHHPYSSSRYLAMWSHNTESKNRLSNLVQHKTIQTMSNYESLGDWNWMVQVSFCSVFMVLFSWTNHEYYKENKEAIAVTGNCDLNYVQCTINPLWQTSIECYLEEKNQRVWKNNKKCSSPTLPSMNSTSSKILDWTLGFAVRSEPNTSTMATTNCPTAIVQVG